MAGFSSIFPWIQIIVSVLLITVILLQRSEAGLGASFGGDGGSFHTKRGAEKGLFIFTIILGALFILSTVVALFIK